MSLFVPASGPRVYALPPGCDYAAAFAEGLGQRLAGQPPEAAARVEVLVATARARQALEAAWVAAAGGPCLVPRLTLIDELAETPPPALAPRDPADAPPAVAGAGVRLMALTRLVARFLAARDGTTPPAAAPALAASLAELMDLLDEEGCAADRLAGAVPPEMARHWEDAFAFLRIAAEAWPARRYELMGAALDGAAARAASVARLTAAWAGAPPEAPVIVAGSTGSRAPTARLMAAVARLPQGALVLPGLDRATPAEVWAAAGEDHPLGPFRRLLETLGLAPGDIAPWVDRPSPPRLRLMGEALRPAPVTDAWVGARETLAALAPEAVAGMALVEAPNQRVEAAAVALIARHALQTPGRRVAIVARDATLARRIAAELGRFGIDPDDSLGRPLASTPAATLLSLVLAVAVRAAAGRAPDPVTLAALLAHPLVRLGRTRAWHRRHARRYERLVLRDRTAGAAPGALAPGWPATGRAPADAAEVAWLDDLHAALDGLVRALAADAPVAALVAAHRAAATALALGPDDDAPGDPEPRDGDAPEHAEPRDGDAPGRAEPCDGDAPGHAGPRDGDAPVRAGPRDGDAPV
ncbi:MAG: hypothetical protein AAF677_15380, partial [Pseudomonadota bacterium]